MISYLLLAILPLVDAHGQPRFTYDDHIMPLWFNTAPLQEDTHGYTKFDAFCDSSVIAKRRYTTSTICANYCDKNDKCEGFLIDKNQCILHDKKCEMKDLKSINGLQKSPHATKYYLKEISCNNTAKCQLAGNCFAPEGYDCICANAICSPRLTNREFVIPKYHHYNGRCYGPEELSRQIPLISLMDCHNHCSSDPNCTSFSVEHRFCYLNRFACLIESNMMENSAQVGFDSFIKDDFYNFTCHSDNECFESPQSWCSKLDPTTVVRWCFCDTLIHNQCVVKIAPQGGISGIFFSRLRTPDNVRNIPTTECTDKHICCSETFPTPGDCSDSDFGMCPKSCGQCKSTECFDRSDECKNSRSTCSDPQNGDYTKAQCPVTCGTCGKTAGSLGVSCLACKDTLPNCEQLANDGLCDDNADKCRKSCGCFKSSP